VPPMCQLIRINMHPNSVLSTMIDYGRYVKADFMGWLPASKKMSGVSYLETSEQ
jgi:hypothetical protein